jgi:curved DNA-binding protein CbpA
MSSYTINHHTSKATGEAREDYYEILNVPYGASKSLVREAYIRLKSAFSVNANAFYSLISDAEAQGMLAKIEEAFRVLNDDIRRREYDRSIGFETDEAQSSDLSFASPPPAPSMRGPAIEVNHEVTPEFAQPPAGNLARSGALSQRPGPVLRKNSDEVAQQMNEMLVDADVGDGSSFKKLRELAGVTSDEIQSRTKVCVEYIRAIEANDFSHLPQPVFVKGFLRSYLRYLSVPDPDRMVKAFAEKYDQWLKAAGR